MEGNHLEVDFLALILKVEEASNMSALHAITNSRVPHVLDAAPR
jgi:hypothetical protein